MSKLAKVCYALGVTAFLFLALCSLVPSLLSLGYWAVFNVGFIASSLLVYAYAVQVNAIEDWDISGRLFGLWGVSSALALGSLFTWAIGFGESHLIPLMFVPHLFVIYGWWLLLTRKFKETKYTPRLWASLVLSYVFVFTVINL